jgi:hypothetical protein
VLSADVLSNDGEDHLDVELYCVLGQLELAGERLFVAPKGRSAPPSPTPKWQERAAVSDSHLPSEHALSGAVSIPG